MQDIPAKGVHAELRGVRREMLSARDEQLVRVVALVDAMPQRGEADALVAPFRERLAVLRPVRPVNFQRLLFTPLDPVIMPVSSWRRGAQGVPRHTIAPLSAVVRSAMLPRAKAIEQDLAQLAGSVVRNRSAAIACIGRMVWPEAARILDAAAMPAEWRADTGLGEEDFAFLARLVSTLLAMAADRQDLIDETRRDGIAEPNRIANLIATSLRMHPDAAVLATALLLVGTPRPDLIIQAADLHAAGAGANTLAVTEQAIDCALEQTLRYAAGAADLSGRISRLRDSAVLLQAIEARPSSTGPRRAMIKNVRQTVDTACRDNFSTTINSHLLAPLKECQGAASDVQVATLEQTARDLRDLEAVGRQVGQASTYKDLLQSTLKTVQTSQVLSLADRVRLTELLADTETAMHLLKGRL
jgi:hypothetical protein